MRAKKQTGIKSRERVQKYGEVFTPPHIVEKMLDMVEESAPDIFSNIHKTFLEPACGTGNFLVAIYARKLDYCRTPLDALYAVNSIYGVDILPDNVRESRERLYSLYRDKFGESQTARDILECNIVCGDFLTGLDADGMPIWFLEGE